MKGRCSQMKVLFSGGAVYSAATRQFVMADILTDDGMITEIDSHVNAADAKVVDCTGKYILPGLVDVHTHGRAGFDFNDIDEAAVMTMRQAYAKAGTTTIMATLASAEPEKLDESMRIINAQRDVKPGMATIAGIHLEGRYLNPGRRGAHAPHLLAPLDPDELNTYLDKMMPLPIHVSAAVEMENGDAFIKAAREKGATVAMVHSDATYEQTRHAVEMGIRSFSHTFNDMKPVHHREPGNAVGSLLSDECWSEFICDGEHLNPAIVKMAVRCKPADKFMLVTDSMAAAGCSDGNYSIAGLPVIVKNGRAVNEEGALAGSTLDLFKAITNTMAFCDLPLEEVIPFATANPAAMLGISDVCGQIRIGCRADFILIEDKENPAIESVWCAGERV